MKVKATSAPGIDQSQVTVIGLDGRFECDHRPQATEHCQQNPAQH
jgi:hypothetical protein